MNRLISVLISCLFLTTGCASKKPVSEINIQSPLGIYRSDTKEQFWLAVLENEGYLICDTSGCESRSYERVAVDYGIILLDFYGTQIGQAIEKKIHGDFVSAEFIAAMTNIRKQQLRPNDLVFNLRECGEILCAAIGHSREGVKFYKVESFDNFWLKQ